jgi:hypothetical protein
MRPLARSPVTAPSRLTGPLEAVRSQRPQSRLGDLDLDRAVLVYVHREGVHRQEGGKRERPAGADVELRPVPRTDHDPLVGIELSFGERTVVVGAAVLDRAQLPVDVEDADQQIARADDLDRAGR